MPPDPPPRNGEGTERSARRTKIVATLGPSTATDVVLRRLLDAGMDVARLNFSYGTHADHGRIIRRLRRLARQAGVPLAILQDLQGPKIRVGRLAHPVPLEEGGNVVLTTSGGTREPDRGRDRAVGGRAGKRIPIAFPRLPRLVRRGQRILLKDGTIELAALRIVGGEIHCRVVRGGTIGEHQGVNIPGLRIRGSALTAKDVADLRFGLRHGVDYVAMSFVRTAGDLRHARRIMRRLGNPAPLVAKLEKAEAIANLDGIIAEADAVMVARGDLGVETAPEQVPLLQKRIIHLANARGIPVITATQMLESMVHAERPTRAETSDVANAILDGTDAVMLSAETAAGEHPVEAVAMMARIAETVDGSAPLRGDSRRPPRPTFLHAIGAAAEALAADLRLRTVVVLTTTGRSAQLLSQFRPPSQIVACTEDERVARFLALYWGVRPVVLLFRRDTEAMIEYLDRELTRRRMTRRGEELVIVGSMPLIARGRTNFLQLHRVAPSRVPPHRVRRARRMGGRGRR